MYWNEHIKYYNSQIPPCDNQNKEYNSGSAEYAYSKICIFRTELIEDCDSI